MNDRPAWRKLLLMAFGAVLLAACSSDSGGGGTDDADVEDASDIQFDRRFDIEDDEDAADVVEDLGDDVTDVAEDAVEDVVDDGDAADGDTGEDAATDVPDDTGTDLSDASDAADAVDAAETGDAADVAEEDTSSPCDDNDGDGHGVDCTLGTDCDDDDPFTYEGAPQICDGNDNTCALDAPPADETDGDGDHYVSCPGFFDWQEDNGDILGGSDCDDDDGSVYPGTETCSPIYYHEGFENGPGGWSTAGTNSSWEWGAPNNVIIGSAAEGTQAWVTNLDGDHNNSEISYLISPPFDFSDRDGDPILRFKHIRNLEGFDGVWLETSVDGGSWTKLGAWGEGDNWYSHPTNQWWSNNSTGWVQSEHFLTGTAGHGLVRLRFVLSTTTTVNEEGFGVDDVAIYSDIVDMGVTAIDVNPVGCGVSETTPVGVTLENLGTEPVTDMTVTISLDDVEIATETVSGTIPADTVTTYDFTATLDLTAGGTITVIANVPGDQFPENNTLAVGTDDLPGFVGLPYFENFEATNGDWFTHGTSSSWAWGTPTTSGMGGAYNGAKAWATSLTGNYNSSETSYLESPCMNLADVTEDPLLQFGLFYRTENNFDEAWLEMSTNGGDSWGKVLDSAEARNWYNDTSNDWWENNSNGWVSARTRLVGAAGEADVRLRFVFSSDSSFTYEGIGVDDVLVTGSDFIDVAVTSIDVTRAGCNPGAAEEVSVGLRNNSTTAISDIPLELSVNGDVVATETRAGSVAIDGNATYAFTATVDLSAVGDYTVTVRALVPDDQLAVNDAASADLSNLGDLGASLPYVEDFEDGAGGWTTYGSNNDWALGTPNDSTIDSAFDGTAAWVTNLTADYRSNQTSYVQGPCFDFTTLDRDPLLRLGVIYDTESCCDEGTVQLSTDGGDTWRTLTDDGTANNWYNTDDGWAGSSGGWLDTAIRLDGVAGESDVRVRVRFDSDGSLVHEGLGFDGVTIENDLRDDLAVLSVIVEGDRCGYDAAELVTAKIANLGPAPVGGAQVTLDIDGGELVTDTLADEIPTGGSVLHTFSVAADLSEAGTHTLTSTVTIPEDGNLANNTLSRSIDNVGRISTLPWAESFESGAGGFITYGTNSSWERGTPAGTNIASANDGTKAWVTNLDGDYNNGELSFLELPCFDFSGFPGGGPPPSLSFDHIFETEPCCDDGFVEYSLDGGASWSRLVRQSFSANWYNDIVNQWWDGSSAGWRTATIALDGLQGQPDVRIRFVLESDDTVSAEGFGVDAVEMNAP